jgi:hypothetical protein
MKRQIFKLVGILLTVFVITGCSGKVEHRPVDIKLEKDLTIGGSEEDINQVFKLILSATVDGQGNIYILDTNLGVVRKFDKDGKFLWELNRKGQGPGEFLRVVDLATGSDGQVFIVDQNSRKIMIFSGEGHFIDEFKVIEGEPTEIAVDSKDFIYVNFPFRLKDFLIHKYNPRGEKITAFMEAGFSEEKDRFLREAKNGITFCIDRQDNIYATYTREYKTLKYSPSGKLLKVWTRDLPKTPQPIWKYNPQPGWIEIKGDRIIQDIAVDSTGNVYALWGWMDSEKGLLIDIFNPDGQYLGNFYSGVKPVEDSLQFFHIDRRDNLYIIEPLTEPQLYRFKMLKNR